MLANATLAFLSALAGPQDLSLELTTSVSPLAGNGFVAIPTEEEFEGVDLNGDGEIGSLIRVAQPDGSDGTFLLGLGNRATTDGDWFAYYWSESYDATDANGDGDATDLLAAVHHFATGTTRILPYTISTNGFNPQTSTLDVRDGLWAFRVRELTQGQDLNGDGDLLDRIQVVHNALQNVTYQTGIASTGHSVGLGWAVFHADESAQGADLNWDGDTLDRVPHAVRGSDGAVINLGLAGSIDSITYPLMGILVDEAQQGGTDLSGDGDAADIVLHVLDLSTGSLTNTHATVYTNSLEGTLESSGRAIVFRSAELSEGVDLNADGDLLDRVVQVWDGPGKAVVNLGVGGSISSFTQWDRPALDYPIVAVNASGGLVTYDISTQTRTSTGIFAFGAPLVHSGYVFLQSATDAGTLRYDAFSGELLELGAQAHVLEILFGTRPQLKFSGGSAYFVGAAQGGTTNSFWQHELATGKTTNLGGSPDVSDHWDLGETEIYYLRDAPNPPWHIPFALSLPE